MKVGDKARVFIEVDNRMCKKPIKSLKLKLERQIGNTCFEQKKYIAVAKFPKDCGVKCKLKSTVEIEIPSLDQYNPSAYSELPEVWKQTLEQEYFPRLQTLTPTFQGKLFHVAYVLKAYVKHDSLTERGEGNFVEFPLVVVGRPGEAEVEKKGMGKAKQGKRGTSSASGATASFAGGSTQASSAAASTIDV